MLHQQTQTSSKSLGTGCLVAPLLSICLEDVKPHEKLGIGLRKHRDGRFVVRHIQDDSPFAATNLRPGAVVEKVNGISLEGMNLEQVMKLCKSGGQLLLEARGP